MEFIEARERGEQEQYLKEQGAIFLHEQALHDMLFNLFTHPTLHLGRDMYECEACGRIWLQARPDKNDLVSYQPESTRKGILSHEGAISDE